MVVETQHQCFKLQKGHHTTSLTNAKNTQIPCFTAFCYIFCGEWTQRIPSDICAILIDLKHDNFCGRKIFLAKVSHLKWSLPVEFQMTHFPKNGTLYLSCLKGFPQVKSGHFTQYNKENYINLTQFLT